MKYKGHLNQEKTLQGNASVYLPAVHFTILLYSKTVADFITSQGFDLYAQNDFAFMNNVLQMLAAVF